MLVSSPVVMLPPTIRLAPIQDTAIMQAYTQICIRGMLKARIRSALEKSM